MLKKYEILSDIPAIVFEFDGMVTAEQVQRAFQICEDHVDELGGHVYRIVDYSKSHTTYTELLRIVQATKASPIGVDERFTPIMVGENMWIRMGSELLSKPVVRSANLPVVQTQEEAIRWVRKHNKKRLANLSTTD
jgi:hypothetical protein